MTAKRRRCCGGYVKGPHKPDCIYAFSHSVPRPCVCGHPRAIHRGREYGCMVRRPSCEHGCMAYLAVERGP